MEYDKQKYAKVRDRKVLHKVKKQWVVISLALLAALGAKSLAMHQVHADVNNSGNSNSERTVASASQPNSKLVNSQSGQSQTVASQNSSSSDYQIMQQAGALKRNIVQHAMMTHVSNSGLAQGNDTKSPSLSHQALLNPSHERQLGNQLPNVPKSDMGQIHFQYRNQNGQTVGKPATVTGQIGNHITLSDVTNYHGALPLPTGYHLRNYYNNSGKTLYYYKKQPDNWVIHIQGNSISPSPIKVYLHIENSDVGSDVELIPDYVPRNSNEDPIRIGSVIAHPNQFLNDSNYAAYFDNHPSDYHLTNQDNDVYAQMDANGQILPKRIDYYYARKTQGIPNGFSKVKTYYYDRQDYDPEKSFAWNNTHSLVHDSVIPELGIVNKPFDYSSRQKNVPKGYYYIKELSPVPTKFGANKTTEYDNIEVAKNAKIVYQIPSDNYRVVNQSDVKGFNMNGGHDLIAPYIKHQTGLWTVGGPYTTSMGNQPVNTISNGQTYYVNLSREVPVKINYFDENQPNHVIYSVSTKFMLNKPQTFNNANVIKNNVSKWRLVNSKDADAIYNVSRPQTINVPVYTSVTGHVIYHDVSDNQDFDLPDNKGVITGQSGMPINYQDYIKYVPANYHLNTNDASQDANWKLLSDNDYSIDIDRNQGQVNVNYITNNDPDHVLKTVSANGYVGTPVNDAVYTNNDYINKLINGYHFDHIVNNEVATYSNTPQDLYVDLVHNSEPVHRLDASVALSYVDQNGQVQKYMNVLGLKGTQIPYNQYVASNYIPQGYSYVGLGAHANTYENGSRAIILIRKNSPAPRPQMASVKLDYVDHNNGSIVRQLNVTGLAGSPIVYDQYSSLNNIPQGYTYTGLGNHTNTFVNGTTDVILIAKKQPAPQPQVQIANATLNYVDNNNGTIQKSVNISGPVGNLIKYYQYITPNQIPAGYTYVGLGNHSNVFQNGAAGVILIHKIPVIHRSSEPVSNKVYSHKRSSIDVVYEDPQGHVIKKRVYKGTAGETFNTSKSRALPGYRFRKVVLGNHTDKFGKHRQLVIMQMLPLSHIRTAHKRSRDSNAPAHESSQPGDYEAKDNRNGYDANMDLGAASRLNDGSNTVSSQNDGNNDDSGSQSNGKLPQTGETQSGDVQVLLGMILLMSAILIAGYDFDLKRRN